MLSLDFICRMMVQRYKIFFLFIFILNCYLVSCNSESSQKTIQPKGSNTIDMAQNIEIGSKAPEFSLPDQQGKRVNLSDFLGKTNLVVYFYPKDESYGCTKEACSFRDSYEDFKEAGAEVIGISADDETSHKEFSAHHKLPFILLSDKDKKVAALFNIKKTMGILPGRVTFVIDKEGVIRMIYSSQLSFQKHVEEAVEVVKSMK